MVTTLEQLVAHRDRFDYILIETTGLANPGPVVAALWTDDTLDNRLRLDGVVCVVDSLNIPKYLSQDDISDDVKTQICYADRILLNKADLVTAEQVCMSTKLKIRKKSLYYSQLILFYNACRLDEQCSRYGTNS